MPNDWGTLGLGGVGRVDIRGATPPIGGTGPGGVEGMGLLALLRRLSMGMDEPGQSLPEPMSPDPAAARGMPQALGQPDQMMDLGRMMMGLQQPPMISADDLSGGAGQDQLAGMPEMPPSGFMPESLTRPPLPAPGMGMSAAGETDNFFPESLLRPPESAMAQGGFRPDRAAYDMLPGPSMVLSEPTAGYGRRSRRWG